MASKMRTMLFSNSRSKYSEIPTSEQDEPDTPLPRRRSHFRSIVAFLICAALVAVAGYWSTTRISQPPKDAQDQDAVSKPVGIDDSHAPGAPTSRPDVDLQNSTKALIVASYIDQDVSWLPLIPSDWRPYRYFLDDPNPPNNLSVPLNQGREAMVYLTYIIDHYEDLPDFMVFTHGHYRAWHQLEPLPAKIRALNLTSLSREGYISLRCGDQMGCERQPFLDTQNPNWAGEVDLPKFWNRIMPNVTVPRFISYKCCGQHAVTRQMVTRRSKEDWVRIRAPLLEDISSYRVDALDGSWIVGTFYEKFWHILLGPSSENCPSIEQCEQEFFSNAFACDRGTDLMNFEKESPWEETVCRSAYDGVPPNEPADLDTWHAELIGTFAELRVNRREKENERLEKLRLYADMTKAETETDETPSDESPGDSDSQLGG